MKKIDLKISQQIQGEHEIKSLNMLLVFQVNCPGCFAYALPLFNKLYNEFSSREISFLALSTAFEDFNKNTLPNTIALVKNGSLVEGTKKMMMEQGYNTLPFSLNFPIAMDSLEEKLDDIDLAIHKICNNVPNYINYPEFEKITLQKRVKDYLNSLEKIAFTFTLNQLRGTPSFILYNDKYEILNQWFGHTSYDTISKKIKSHQIIL